MPHAPQPCVHCTAKKLRCEPAEILNPKAPCAGCRKARTKCSWLPATKREKKKEGKPDASADSSAAPALPPKRLQTQTNAIAGPSRLPPSSTGQACAAFSAHAGVPPSADPGLTPTTVLVDELRKAYGEITACLETNLQYIHNEVSGMADDISALGASQSALLKQGVRLTSEVHALESAFSLNTTSPGISG